MSEVGGRRAGDFGRVVPQAHLHGFRSIGLADELLGFAGAVDAALEHEAALGILGQFFVIARSRGAKIALGIDMQADRGEHRFWKQTTQERQCGVLVPVVDAAQRRRLAAVVEQMADVVQQRRADELGRRTGALGVLRALQRVLELAYPLAFVSAPAFLFQQLQDLL